MTGTAAFSVLVVALAAWSLMLAVLGEPGLALGLVSVAVVVGAVRLAWVHRRLRSLQQQTREEQP